MRVYMCWDTITTVHGGDDDDGWRTGGGWTDDACMMIER